MTSSLKEERWLPLQDMVMYTLQLSKLQDDDEQVLGKTSSVNYLTELRLLAILQMFIMNDLDFICVHYNCFQNFQT